MPNNIMIIIVALTNFIMAAIFLAHAIGNFNKTVLDLTFSDFFSKQNEVIVKNRQKFLIFKHFYDFVSVVFFIVMGVIILKNNGMPLINYVYYFVYLIGITGFRFYLKGL